MPLNSHMGIRVKGSGGKGGDKPRTPVEAPNTLQSRATARLVHLIGAGRVRGLVNDAQSIFLEKTPYQNPDKTYNFDGVKWAFLNGTPDQDYLPGFSEVESEYGVGVQVKYGYPITRTITDPDINALRLTVTIPALFTQNAENGDVDPARMAYTFEISTDGGPWKTAVNWDSWDKTTSPAEISHRVPLESGKRWDVRLVRQIPDSTAANVNNSLTWSRYTRIIEAKLTYPDCAVLGIEVDSALFGSSVPKIAVEIYGRDEVPIPSNYNPETREYSGFWDGTFKRGYTTNPAWCLYDLLTSGIDGVGREFGFTDIDKWGLYEIGQYCDELVPDGRGGMEPRFTCNGSLVTREASWETLSLFAGSFRTVIFPANGTVFFYQDKPENYCRILTPANVIDGIFNYEGTDVKSRHSVVNVSWLNPELGFEPDVEVVEDPEIMYELGWRPLDEVAAFCTSRGQAWRQGAMALDAEKNCTEAVSFAAGLDCLDILPGKVIAIADPIHAGIRSGGRIAEISSIGATLDAPFPFSSDQAYFLSVTMQDSSMVDIALKNPGEETSTVEFLNPVEHLPSPGAIFCILSTNLAPRLFRIMNIREGDGIKFEFTGLIYDPTRYDRVEKGINLPDTPTTIFPSGGLPSPKNLTATEYVYLSGGLSPTAAVMLSWTYTDPRALAFDVEWKTPGGSNFSGRTTVSAMSLDIDINYQGVYEFRVRAIDSLGRTSQWANVVLTAQALFRPPAAPDGFLGVANGETLTLSWDRVPDLLAQHYEIRFSPNTQGQAEWEGSVRVGGDVSRDTTSVSAPLRAGTFFIKTVSIKGVYSQFATALTNGISADFLGHNVVVSSHQNPEWKGFKAGVASSNDTLFLSDKNSDEYVFSGLYYFSPPTVDLSAVYESRLTPEVSFYASVRDEDVYSSSDVYALDNVYSSVSAGGVESYLEYSISALDPESSPAIDIYAEGDVYDLSDVYETPDFWGPWVRFDSPVKVQARAYRFRLVLKTSTPTITPVVTAANVIVDMPDRVLSVDDFVVPSTEDGYYFYFSPPFKESPSLSPPMIQDGQEGDSYRITEKSREGFRLFLSNSGLPVSRSVDWVAKGYGFSVNKP